MLTTLMLLLPIERSKSFLHGTFNSFRQLEHHLPPDTRDGNRQLPNIRQHPVVLPLPGPPGGAVAHYVAQRRNSNNAPTR